VGNCHPKGVPQGTVPSVRRNVKLSQSMRTSISFISLPQFHFYIIQHLEKYPETVLCYKTTNKYGKAISHSGDLEVSLTRFIPLMDLFFHPSQPSIVLSVLTLTNDHFWASIWSQYMDEFTFFTLISLINHRIPHVPLDFYECRF